MGRALSQGALRARGAYLNLVTCEAHVPAMLGMQCLLPGLSSGGEDLFILCTEALNGGAGGGGWGWMPSPVAGLVTRIALSGAFLVPLWQSTACAVCLCAVCLCAVSRGLPPRHRTRMPPLLLCLSQLSRRAHDALYTAGVTIFPHNTHTRPRTPGHGKVV